MGGWDFHSPPIGKARRAPSIAAVISDMIQGWLKVEINQPK